MQVVFKPKDIAPQVSHVLTFDLKELKPINAKITNNRGIKNNRSKILLRKLMKKFIPKIEIATSAINE